MSRAIRVAAALLAVAVVGIGACALLAPGRFAPGGGLFFSRSGPGPAAAPSGTAEPVSGPTAERLSAAALARGERVYRDHPCASCHEPRRAGSGVVARPLTNLSRRYSLESLAVYLRTPNPPMPAFPLTDAERSDLAAYLLARHP